MEEIFNEETLEIVEINDPIVSIPEPMYIEVNFTSGQYSGRYYQKVINGVVVDIVDPLGNSITANPIGCEYEVVTGEFLTLIP